MEQTAMAVLWKQSRPEAADWKLQTGSCRLYVRCQPWVDRLQLLMSMFCSSRVHVKFILRYFMLDTFVNYINFKKISHMARCCIQKYNLCLYIYLVSRTLVNSHIVIEIFLGGSSETYHLQVKSLTFSFHSLWLFSFSILLHCLH